MKDGWVVKKIKDICEKASSNITQQSLKDISGDYPIYGASGYIKNVNFYHQDKEYIGIVKDGSGIGRTMLLPAYSSVIGTIQYILPKNSSNLKFVYYALESLNLAKFKNGAAIPHIYFRDYGESIIAVPPLSEQERIVSVLDSAFAKIEAMKDNAARNLANAKELFQSELQIAMMPKEGWKVKKLGDVCKVIGGKDYKAVYDENGQYPIYGSGGMMGYANDFLCPENCTLIGRKGTINSPIYVQTKLWNIDTAFGISAIDCLPRFIFYFCQSFDFTTLDSGSGRPSLKKTDIEKITIGSPSLTDQQRIVSHLDALSEKVKQLEAAYKQTIADCEELKQSLLRQAFNGEL